MAVFKLLLLVAFLLLAPYASASPFEPLSTNLISVDDSSSSLSSSITSVLIEWISSIVEYLFELFDLKMRSIRFLVSLYNDENLHLFKRYADIGLRVMTWIHDMLPENTSEASLRFLSYLFPQENGPAEELHRLEHSTMPSLLHSFSLDNSDYARENKFDESNKVAEEVNPFADQVMSLQNLINARQSEAR